MTADLDLVLVGATGYVGRLTAAHLAGAAPQGCRIALAGRSVSRLAQVRSSLGDRARDWPLLRLDLTDVGAVAELCGRARVVATTVGPYAVHGMPLVRACAAAGTDYADVTGEVLFVHRSVAECHDAAQASGARIVHSCGFDSVPSDLGVLLCAQAAEAGRAGQLTSTVLHVRTLRGGVSGGTIDSMRRQVIAARRDPVARRVLADPYSLLGAGGTGGADGAYGAERPPYRQWLRVVPVGRDDGTWHGPFVMASYNTRLVLRSGALLGYGDQLRYREVLDTGRGVRGGLIAAGVAAGLMGFGAVMAFGPTRALADRWLPKPGEGPSQRRRSAGRFAVQVDASTATGAQYRTTVAADLDPGYDGTAVMLGQSALALAAGEGIRGGGVLTPASALGVDLVRRLWDHDFTLETALVSASTRGT